MTKKLDTMLDLNRGQVIEHWLLNLAVERPVSLGFLFPEIETEGLNVRPIPHCGSEDYARGLLDLFVAELITLDSEFREDDVGSRGGVSTVLDRFRRLSKEDSKVRHLLPRNRQSSRHGGYQPPSNRVYFQLTTRGGEAWEKVAEPDWKRFISASTRGAIQGQSEAGELISAHRDLLIAYMGWYPEVNGEQIQLDTVKWQTHTDFEILYWKRLPFVYHASFQVGPAEARWNGYREPQWFRDWWTSTCSWHKKPWHLPNWPSE
jgi:hypothetical protein